VASEIHELRRHVDLEDNGEARAIGRHLLEVYTRRGHFFSFLFLLFPKILPLALAISPIQLLHEIPQENHNLSTMIVSVAT
jgi:hypothetical protein